MKISPRCPYCLLSRVHYQCNLSTDDPGLVEKVMKECLSVMSREYRGGRTSTDVATAVHRKCYEVLNDSDPYRNIKKINNETALEILPSVLKLIYGTAPSGEAYTLENSPYPLETIFKNAVLAAVIGNYFDFGVMGHDASDDDFKKEFENHFKKGLATDDTEDMLKRLPNVVYLIDNCGEIVFDREVLRIIQKIQKNMNAAGQKTKLILVVRGKPILTDVTLKEAEELELEDFADEIMTTGTDTVGISIREAPKNTVAAMKEASLIISKGMANYESLSDENLGPIAFLLRTKCEAVAESLGLAMGMSVAKMVNGINSDIKSS
ncbi:damage-control phosphatase ARMT1 family protein [Methanolapillus millepedarum]|uniref:Damage-control phosphatase ARMT1-like metal-binding domain-containing protein n=1 Tax=Methanolapillus millepedarum TaxID=3028296 RepID=A0AA96ZTZ7_9EURY|nr:hypothetical protein MsAc7_06080 [Methanosarcinaceae archaeon Ac7]